MTEIPAPFDPDWVIPPGETLRESLEGIERTAQDLAEGTGLDVEWINSFLAGEAEITVEQAEALVPWTQVPASLWLALEANYRIGLERGRTVIGLDEEA